MMRKWIGVICALILLPSCQLVAHKITAKSNTTSAILFDGNAQNAGVLRINPDKSRVITEGARQHYNRLIDLYGDQIGIDHHDAGLTPETPEKIQTQWTISLDFWQKALRMSQWRRDGRPTTGIVKRLLNKI